MEDETRMRIADKFNDWCEHCQLFAIKYFIWNVENPQHLEEIVSEALNTLPGKLGPEDYIKSLRLCFQKLQHADLRDISTQVSLLLESPCFNDACLKECKKFGSKK